MIFYFLGVFSTILRCDFLVKIGEFCYILFVKNTQSCKIMVI